MLLFCAIPAATFSNNRTSSEPQSGAIERAFAEHDGSVHVMKSGGQTDSVPKEKDQVGSSMIKIAEDGRTVGWTVLYDNCCTSYPIPLLLVIYKDGKVQQRLNKGGQMIYDWGFRASGKQVAFCTGTTHGDSGGHCELHDAITSRTIAVINGHLDKGSPAWARGLQN